MCINKNNRPTSGGSEYPPRFFLAEDTRFECYKDTWYFFLPFNIFFMITFSMAVPSFMIYILLKYRGKLQHLEVSDKFGHFYKRAKPGYEWWELLEIFRRFMLTSVISLIPYEGAKIGVALLVSTFVLVCLNYFRPHKDLMIFWMTNICYCATVVVFISVATISILSKSSESEEVKDGIGIFLVSIHVVVFILMMVTIRIGTVNFIKKYDEAKVDHKAQDIKDNRIIELVAHDDIGDGIHIAITENDKKVAPKYHHKNAAGIDTGKFVTNDTPISMTTSINKSSDFSIPRRQRRKTWRKIAEKEKKQTI